MHYVIGAELAGRANENAHADMREIEARLRGRGWRKTTAGLTTRHTIHSAPSSRGEALNKCTQTCLTSAPAPGGEHAANRREARSPGGAEFAWSMNNTIAASHGS